MALRAGQLRNRLIVQVVTQSQDAQGGLVETWTDVGYAWGSLETLSGRELMYAAQCNSLATMRITIRYFSGLTERHRLVFGTRTFGIESINNVDEAAHTMCLQCRELR